MQSETHSTNDLVITIKARKEITGSSTGTVLFEYKKSYKATLTNEFNMMVKDEVGGIRHFNGFEKDKWFKEHFTIVKEDDANE